MKTNKQQSEEEIKSKAPSFQGTLRLEGAHFHSALQVSCSCRTCTPDRVWWRGEGWKGKEKDGMGWDERGGEVKD